MLATNEAAHPGIFTEHRLSLSGLRSVDAGPSLADAVGEVHLGLPTANPGRQYVGDRNPVVVRRPILDRSSPYDRRIWTEPNPERTDLGEAARQRRLKVLAMLVTYEGQRREAAREDLDDAGPGLDGGHAGREDVGHAHTGRRAVGDRPRSESVGPCAARTRTDGSRTSSPRKVSPAP